MIRRTLALGLLVAGALAPVALAVERTDLLLPGRLICATVGDGAVWIVAGGDDEEPRTLLRRAPGSDRLEIVAAGLSAEAGCAFAVPGDPAGGLLVQVGDAVRRLDRSGAATGDLPGRVVWGPGASGTFRPVPSAVRLQRLGEIAPLAGGAAVAVATRAERTRWGLRFASPRTTILADGRLLVGLEAEGLGRVPGIAIQVGAADGVLRPRRLVLPEREHVGDVGVVTVSDRPWVWAATFREVGPFANQRLRVFALDGGEAAGPVLARELEGKMWQETAVVGGDADGDGRADLLVATPEGMGEEKLRISFHRGRSDGSFDTRPVDETVVVAPGRWRLGDVTGDGRPDLVRQSGNRVWLQTGAGPGRFADGPAVDLRLEALPDAEGKPRDPGLDDLELVDLDGDGRLETVGWRREGEGTRVVVLRW